MSFVLVSLVSMLFVLGVLVLVHEFGHFVVAKMCGVRVETFSIGFGKRLFGFRRGDTDYRISALPLGGYVKMSGETVGDIPTGEATTDPGNYGSHPRWQRVLIACAGPAANFLLAFVLMTIVYMGHNEVPNFLSGPAVVDYVLPGSAAANAGLQPDDRIVRFDGVQNPTWQQIFVHSVLNLNHSVAMRVEDNGQEKKISLPLTAPADPDNFALSDAGFTPVEQHRPLKIAVLDPDMPGAKAGLKIGDAIISIDGTVLHSLTSMILYLQQNGAKPVTLNILRDGKPMTFVIRPESTMGEDGKHAYKIGFAPDPPPSHVERLSLPQAFSHSVQDNVKGSTLIVDVLRRVATHRMSLRTLSGPVGIARQTGHIVAMPGWSPLLSEMSSISLNLGILNLLPIPILDGGVILFLLIESIMQRDLNEKFKERVYQTAFVFLILMTVFVLFNDLSKIPALTRLRL
ncbi:MAG: RIP metalloprotease RseP [Acidobacteriaceae bacterium]